MTRPPAAAHTFGMSNAVNAAGANRRIWTGAIGGVLLAVIALALAWSLALSHSDPDSVRQTPEPTLPPGFVR